MGQIAMLHNHVEKIKAHAESSYPHECCGILLGSIDNGLKKIEEIWPIDNANNDSPQNRYLIPPEEVLRGERHARENDLELLGYYHSHPDTAAEPSEYDREHAWPWYSYVIIAVHNQVAEEMRTWELKADRSQFIEHEIVSIERDLAPKGGS